MKRKFCKFETGRSNLFSDRLSVTSLKHWNVRIEDETPSISLQCRTNLEPPSYHEDPNNPLVSHWLIFGNKIWTHTDVWHQRVSRYDLHLRRQRGRTTSVPRVQGAHHIMHHSKLFNTTIKMRLANNQQISTYVVDYPHADPPAFDLIRTWMNTRKLEKANGEKIDVIDLHKMEVLADHLIMKKLMNETITALFTAGLPDDIRPLISYIESHTYSHKAARRLFVDQYAFQLRQDWSTKYWSLGHGIDEEAQKNRTAHGEQLQDLGMPVGELPRVDYPKTLNVDN